MHFCLSPKTTKMFPKFRIIFFICLPNGFPNLDFKRRCENELTHNNKQTTRKSSSEEIQEPQTPFFQSLISSQYELVSCGKKYFSGEKDQDLFQSLF